MLEKKKETLKDKFIGFLEKFFRSRTMIIWIALGLVIVGFIVFTAWSEIDKNINQDATTLADECRDKYNDWLYESDEKIKIVLGEELIAQVEKILKSYPGRSAAFAALQIRARYYYDTKDWEKASRYYLEAANGFPGNILAPKCMANAAAAYEEMNDPDKAIKVYEDILAKYKDSYEIPHVLLSLGRINEEKKNYPEAIRYYTELEDKHSASNWTLMAQNRKIYLKSIGY